ncbi:MAG TPA: sigma 54-interacting transcriptional regulator [Bryobacteraceae bacterium]|jgi:formate hydrogenlyase transcriptional activator|nr:sigma 54-interacting transcriptional regulator [Bryobacteraceae bacterium]
MATLATAMFPPRREFLQPANRLIGSSPGMRRALSEVRTVAPTDSAVLIQGETGTGKELIARAVHDQSLRKHAPFVTLNCAAIPGGLLESELFGHERGAYTGAMNSAIGRFQTAHQGTLFLDEIGEMPLELQPKLLRVLQEQEFERLGSTRTIRVDVRIVAATNRDLATMVQERRFRADLYYRLHVFPIALPPLRDRLDDIPDLVRHFVEKFADRMNKHITEIPDEVMQALKRHSWPGNIRELQNFIERAIILTPGHVLCAPLGDLKTDLGSFGESAKTTGGRTLKDAERAHILEVLRQVDWVVGGQRGAAVRLGLPRTTLLHRMHKLGIVAEEARQNSCGAPL